MIKYNNKIFFIFLLLILLFSINVSYAIENNSVIFFKQIDYDEAVNNNEIFKNYDKITGRFLNTDSQIYNDEELKAKEELLKNNIESLKKLKENFSKDNKLIFIEMESDSWHKLKKIDEEIGELEKELKEINELKILNGIPDESLFWKEVSNINKSIKNVIDSENNKDTIVLNKLPYNLENLYSLDLTNEINNIGLPLDSLDESLYLNYFHYVGYIGLLFEKSADSVIYVRNKK